MIPRYVYQFSSNLVSRYLKVTRLCWQSFAKKTLSVNQNKDLRQCCSLLTLFKPRSEQQWNLHFCTRYFHRVLYTNVDKGWTFWPYFTFVYKMRWKYRVQKSRLHCCSLRGLKRVGSFRRATQRAVRRRKQPTLTVLHSSGRCALQALSRMSDAAQPKPHV